MSPTPTATADALIIGGGFTGLSAAQTIYRHSHTILILDSGAPRNSWDTPIRALPGHEGIPPSDLRESSRAELLATGLVRFENALITKIETRSSGDSDNTTTIRLTDSDGRVFLGRKLLLAVGKKFRFPGGIEGYESCFPERIFHCMFTFGWEQRGNRRAGLLALDALRSPRHTRMVVDDTGKVVERVTVYTNGGEVEGLREELAVTGAEVDTRRVVRVEPTIGKGALTNGDANGHTNGDGPVRTDTSVLITFADGSTVAEDFLVHQPATVVDQELAVKQLNLDLDERGDIVVRWPFYHSSVPGVFAAGDCASPFKMVANALLMGSNAGAGMCREMPKRVTKESISWR